jgi:hypothetical protein
VGSILAGYPLPKQSRLTVSIYQPLCQASSSGDFVKPAKPARSIKALKKKQNILPIYKKQT